MHFRWLGVAAVGVGCIAGTGCSTDRESPAPTETVRQPIQGGTNDTTHRFAVGVCRGSPGSCSSVCSGALILPNVVATARHCVDTTPDQVNCSTNPTFGTRRSGSYYITTNSSMNTGGSAGWYSVKSVAVPTDTHVCGNDIALLVLTNVVQSADASPITPGVQYQMWDPDLYGKSFTAIGFGVTGPDKNDSGTRRIKNLVSVRCVPNSETMPCPSNVMGYLSPAEFFAGDGICSGDSGSSAFETKSFNNGAPVSFGVLSRGGETDPDGGVPQCRNSFYTRFDAHRDLVINTAKAASENWSLYGEPAWTAYKPPPSSKKDAGTSSGDTPEPEGTAAFGEECVSSSQCESGTCAKVGDGTKICSQACDEAEESTCPEGYVCRESLCLPPAAGPAAPTTTTRTTSSCAATVTERPTAAWSVLAIGAAALVAAVRRRRAS